jgi:hypothetical protein
MIACVFFDLLNRICIVCYRIPIVFFMFLYGCLSTPLLPGSKSVGQAMFATSGYDDCDFALC